MSTQARLEKTLAQAITPKLLRRARRLMKDRNEAEDLTQETLLRLLQTLRQKDLRNPESYAMIVLHNLARSRWRSRARTEPLEDPDTLSAPPEGPAVLACQEIMSAIRELPEDQAALMLQILGGETSPQALAKKTGCPEGTINSRLARARQTLRKQAGIGPCGRVADLL